MSVSELRAENERLRAYVKWLDSNSTRDAGAVQSFRDFLRNVGGAPAAPPDAASPQVGNTTEDLAEEARVLRQKLSNIEAVLRDRDGAASAEPDAAHKEADPDAS